MTDYPESKLTLDSVAEHSANWNRVLYIGWHPSITAWKGTVAGGGGDWYIRHIWELRQGAPSKHTVIERFKPYYEKLRAHALTKEYGIHCLNVDVVEWAPVTCERFDLIIWWHGPEHVKQCELAPTLVALEKIGTCLILGGPEGPDDYKEPESGDAHRCVLTKNMFEELGYRTTSFDRSKRGQGPHISAIKIV